MQPWQYFLVPLTGAVSASFIGLGDLPGGEFLSDARGVSADGNTVVGYSLGEHGQQAFIWDEIHGMRDLREKLVSDYGLERLDIENGAGNIRRWPGDRRQRDQSRRR